MFGRRDLGNIQVPSTNTSCRHHTPCLGNQGGADWVCGCTGQTHAYCPGPVQCSLGAAFCSGPWWNLWQPCDLPVLLDNASSGRFESTGFTEVTCLPTQLGYSQPEACGGKQGRDPS